MADKTQIGGDEEERLDANDSGVFTWDLETGVVHVDTSVAKLFGLKASYAAGLPIQNYLPHIVEDDRSIAQSIHDAVLTGDPYHERSTSSGF